jgi:hypothetical protein
LPFRTQRILFDTDNAAARLHQVALALEGGGTAAAYRRFAGDCQLKWLGPAFGTKYLYFAQAANARP